jgi:hypothetical protein
MHTPPATATAETRWDEDTLDRALASCIVAPDLPERFRSRVVAAVLTEELESLAVRREQLELEHARELEQLQRSHIALKRNTLTLVAATAFAAGSCIQLALPWLHSRFELDSVATAPLLALLIGLATGAKVWADRFGKPTRFMA